MPMATASPLRNSRTLSRTLSVTPAPPPLPPGTPTADESPYRASADIKCFGVTNTMEKLFFQNVKDAISSTRNLVWIDMSSPTTFEIATFSEAYNFHPITEKDCLHGSSRDKCDVYHNYTVLTSNITENSYIVSILLAENKLLTFHPWESSGICEKVFQHLQAHNEDEEEENGIIIPIMVNVTMNEIAPLKEEEGGSASIHNADGFFGNLQQYEGKSSVWILSKLLEEVVMIFEPKIERMVTEVETLSDLVFLLGVKDANELLVRVGRASAKICDYRMILKPKREVLKRLLRRNQNAAEKDIINDTMINYFGNIMDRIVFMAKRLDSLLSHLMSIQDSYLGQLSIQMAVSSHRLSLSMQQLNIITAVMVPLTVIMGAFSMNVSVPGEVDYSGNLSWFFGILGVMGLFVIFMFFYLRKLTKNTRID